MLKASRTGQHSWWQLLFPLYQPYLKECDSCCGTVAYFNFCVFQPIPEPKGGRLIQVEGYWISVGDKEPTIDETYILTSSVKLNLRDIVRVVSAGCVELSSADLKFYHHRHWWHSSLPSFTFKVLCGYSLTEWAVTFLLAQIIFSSFTFSENNMDSDYFGHLLGLLFSILLMNTHHPLFVKWVTASPTYCFLQVVQ